MGKLKGELQKQDQEMEAQGDRSFADGLKTHWPKIEAVLPRHMSSERMFQMAVSTYNHEPELAKCDIATFLSCLMRCSALGLEPSSVDGLGRAYILPFYNKRTQRKEATFILGYKGMIDLARRSGEIRDISARAVHEGDEFSYEFGLDEHLRHVPGTGERTPETLTHVYMVCHFKDGGHYIDVMTRAEVDAIRERSKAKDAGPWVTDYIAMAIKSVVRRAFKFLPVSVEAQQAAESDETTGGYEMMWQSIDAPPLPAPAEAEQEAPSDDAAPDAPSES